jgi:hypothetical protein
VIDVPTLRDVRLLGVRYVVAPTGIAVPLDGEVVDRAQGYDLFEVADAQPRSSVVPSFRVVPNLTAALRTVLPPTFDPARLAVLERDPGIEPTPDAEPGSATYEEDRPERARLSVNATAPSILVIRTAFDDGWTATVDGIVKNRETPTHLELARYMPGSPNEVTHVYADACKSEGRLESVDASGLPAALEEQAGTAAGTSWFGGLGQPGDQPAGLMVDIREEPGLDRSTCRGGAEGPLQIWADPAETTFFALPPGHRGMAYIFEKDGTTFVFSADIGAEATEADEDSVNAIVGSFEFSPH